MATQRIHPLPEPQATISAKLMAAANYLGNAGRESYPFPEALDAARQLIDAAEAQWDLAQVEPIEIAGELLHRVAEDAAFWRLEPEDYLALLIKLGGQADVSNAIRRVVEAQG